MTADEWLALLAAIQRQPCAYKENQADRAFIAKIINQLTVDNPDVPNAAERKWLLTLKRECKL